ncbi:hypothetical protein DEU56DRAFT_780175 [Suillus clintonianus]|uniref:uncharacterized protein n=1 Tax=Suillus clintonianus TaxID=1904413 RepID=UPI001B85EF4D|nr:uncharacterized protein DEU56DRAFT_780175 [Suillus clintonianus]KAG2150471.1 hypothetical protein DEU56DRAFT_780175 [Suillus clintonianus]
MCLRTGSCGALTVSPVPLVPKIPAIWFRSTAVSPSDIVLYRDASTGPSWTTSLACSAPVFSIGIFLSLIFYLPGANQINAVLTICGRCSEHRYNRVSTSDTCELRDKLVVSTNSMATMHSFACRVLLTYMRQTLTYFIRSHVQIFLCRQLVGDTSHFINHGMGF